MLDEALGFFEHHLGDLRVAFGRFVERRTDDLGIDGALEVGDFLGALVDEQHDDDRFGVVRQDGVGDFLQQDRFARARRRDDEAALAFADGGEQIHHARVDLLGFGFEDEAAGREKRREIVEHDLLFRLVGVVAINRFHLEQREEPFLVLWRTDLSGDEIAGLQLETPDLRGRDVNVLGAGQVIVAGRTEESKTVRQDFQHALTEHHAVAFGVLLENLVDDLVFLEDGDRLDATVARHFLQARHRHGLQVGEIQRFARGLNLDGRLIRRRSRGFFLFGSDGDAAVFLGVFDFGRGLVPGNFRGGRLYLFAFASFWSRHGKSP